MKTLHNCPVCNSNTFNHYLTSTDFTLSQRKFNLQRCQACSFVFTNPRPEDNQLGDYYKSENYISHSDTRKGLISQLYHLVRKHTLQKKISLISKYVSRGTILDYGCGTGMFLQECQNSGWTAIGMEPDAGARQMGFKNGLKVFSDKESLSVHLAGSKVNVISLWHVLEHVTDLDETLKFFKDKLEQDGVLLIAVPNHKSFDSNFYKEFWAAYDVPRHLYHFHVNTIQKLLARFQFKLVQSYPMKFDSFYVSMLSEKYKKGRISYLNAFWTGLRSNLNAKSPTDYSSVIYVFKHV